MSDSFDLSLYNKHRNLIFFEDPEDSDFVISQGDDQNLLVEDNPADFVFEVPFIDLNYN